MWENNLIRKLNLISKFMTLQPGKQIITIHILSNISRNKSNQTITFGQLLEYNVKNIFFKNHAKNKVGRLVSELSLSCFFLKKKTSYEIKASGLHLLSIYFDSSRFGHTTKTKCVKLSTVDSKMCSNLIFLEKCLGLVSPTYFVFDFN